MHIKDWPEGDRPPGNAFGERPGCSKCCRAAGYPFREPVGRGKRAQRVDDDNI